MDISKFDDSMTEDVARLYEQAVRGVPYCAPVALEDFSEAVSDAAEAAEGEPGGEGLREEEILLAAERGRPVGYVHFGVGAHDKEQKELAGYLRFFWFHPEHRQAGQALLDEAEKVFREKGLDRSIAFWQSHRYPFYHRKNSFLSERMAPVAALLGRNEYEIGGGEVFFDWPEMRVPKPPRPAMEFEETVTWNEGKGERPNSEVRAMRDGKQVAACETVSCQESGDGPGVKDWCFVLGLNVTEAFQGRGLGKYLLGRSLEEMRGVGYRHAGISTSMKNYRAALFYSSFSRVQLGDWTYGWVKKLD